MSATPIPDRDLSLQPTLRYHMAARLSPVNEHVGTWPALRNQNAELPSNGHELLQPLPRAEETSAAPTWCSDRTVLTLCRPGLCVWCTPSLRRDSTIVTVCTHTVTIQLDNDCNVFKIVPRALFWTSRHVGLKSPTELRHYISSNSVNLAQTRVYVLHHALTIMSPVLTGVLLIVPFLSLPPLFGIVCLAISVAHVLSHIS